MLAGVEESTPLGARTSYRFKQPYDVADWNYMQNLLDNATLSGLVALRFIDDLEVTVVITGGVKV